MEWSSILRQDLAAYGKEYKCSFGENLYWFRIQAVESQVGVLYLNLTLAIPSLLQPLPHLHSHWIPGSWRIIF